MTVSSGEGAPREHLCFHHSGQFLYASLKPCSVSASETPELNKEEEEEETQGGEATIKERCEGQIKTKPGL